jgi:general secretion pathway protein E
MGKLVTGDASSDVLAQEAKKKGMRTMNEDGFVKAVQGITSLEEVMRVTKE